MNQQQQHHHTDHDGLILRKIRQQIEYYFSPQFIAQNYYIQAVFRWHYGAAPVNAIESFPIMQDLLGQLSKRDSLENHLVRCLEDSRLVTLSHDRKFIHMIQTEAPPLATPLKPVEAPVVVTPDDNTASTSTTPTAFVRTDNSVNGYSEYNEGTPRIQEYNESNNHHYDNRHVGQYYHEGVTVPPHVHARPCDGNTMEARYNRDAGAAPLGYGRYDVGPPYYHPESLSHPSVSSYPPNQGAVIHQPLPPRHFIPAPAPANYFPAMNRNPQEPTPAAQHFYRTAPEGVPVPQASIPSKYTHPQRTAVAGESHPTHTQQQIHPGFDPRSQIPVPPFGYAGNVGVPATNCHVWGGPHQDQAVINSGGYSHHVYTYAEENFRQMTPQEASERQKHYDMDKANEERRSERKDLERRFEETGQKVEETTVHSEHEDPKPLKSKNKKNKKKKNWAKKKKKKLVDKDKSVIDDASLEEEPKTDSIATEQNPAHLHYKKQKKYSEAVLEQAKPVNMTETKKPDVKANNVDGVADGLADMKIQK